MTQEQLGKLARIDYKHIGGLERGEHTPSFAAIERLSRVLKVPYHELFTTDETLIGQIEDNVDALQRDVDQLQKPELKRFFDDMLGAVRRLRGR